MYDIIFSPNKKCLILFSIHIFTKRNSQFRCVRPCSELTLAFNGTHHLPLPSSSSKASKNDKTQGIYDIFQGI